ncbi:MAG: IS200/IS605 family transposase [Prevotella sp.]|nr:IS200/IS605 family transposase [Prevotella sp.]
MSYTNLIYHIVFRPHGSRPVIVEAHEKELYAYILGFCRAKGCVLYRIGGMPDHIHMLVSINQSISVSDFVRELKVSTNKFIKQNREHFPDFTKWAEGYCAISYNFRDKDMIYNYIKNQKEHHKRVGFYDELKQMCQENGINIDDMYFLKDR